MFAFFVGFDHFALYGMRLRQEMKWNGLKDPPTSRIEVPSYLPTEDSFSQSLKPVSPSQPL